MKLGKDSALEKLRTSKDDLISALKKESATWDSFDDKEAHEILDIYEKNKYVFSNSVIDTLHTIKVNDAFDCNILKERKTSNGIIIIDSTELYIFKQIGDKLKVINFTVSIKDDYSDIQLFTFNLKQNEKIIDETIETEVWKKFIRCLIYLDFLPTETKYINPNEKFGTRKQGKIINETDQKLILVTKAWNQEYKTKPKTKFYSKDHWGIRWTGIGRKLPKVSFIKGSIKGINKLAEKEIKR
jgi:hypothetical protein